MDYACFDTGALIQRQVEEPGRREVLGLLRQNQCVVSAAFFKIRFGAAVNYRRSNGERLSGQVRADMTWVPEYQNLRVTFAMEAGIADHVGSIEEIVGLRR